MKHQLLTALRRALYSLLFLAGLAVFAVLVLVGTQAGTTFMLRTALDQGLEGSPLRVEVADINGTVFGDLTFSQLNVRDTQSGLRVNAESVELSLDVFSLLNKTVQVNRLEVRGLAVTPPTVASEEESDPVTLLETLFDLPVTVQVDAISVSPFTLNGPQPQTLQTITASLQLDTTHAHVAARIERDNATWMAPDITLNAGNYTLMASVPWQALLADQDMAGELTVSGDIDAVDIRHTLNSPLAVLTEGRITTGLRNTFGFNLTHQANNVGGTSFGVPELENFSGTVTTAGTPVDITISADADVRVSTLGNSAITFRGQYSEEVFDIREAAVSNERFELDAIGNMAFVDGLTMNLSWQLANFTDGDLLSQVELVDVNGNGAVTISTSGNETVTELSLASLTGNLNGYPLSGNGEVVIAGGTVNNVTLTLISDVNSLLLEGTVSPQLDLVWELQAPELTQLLTGLSGEIIGTGTMTGSTEEPQISGMLDAAGLSYANGTTTLEVNTLSANANYNGDTGNSTNAVNLVFTGLRGQVNGNAFNQEQGMLEITGNPADHAFSVSTRGQDLSLVISGAGAYIDQSWNGTVDTAEINSPFGFWELQDDLSLAYAPGMAMISNHCWMMQDIQVCAQSTWQEAGGLAGNLAIDNIPLGWFNDNLPANVPDTDNIRQQLAARPSGLVYQMDAWRIAMPVNGLVEGMLDLTMEFNGLGGEWENATLSAVLVPRDVSLGIIRPPEDDNESSEFRVERYGIDDVALTVDRMAARWLLDSSFEIYLSESGGLDFQGDFAGNFTLTEDEVLGGNFELTFNNIAWMEAIIPSITQVRGELGASGSIAGTLERPLLNMQAALDNGSFQLPEYGLALSDVGLAFNSANNNEITITGMATSGQGSINLESLLTMPLLESRTLHMEVLGDNFELMNTEEIRMTVAPDLVLDYRDKSLNVNGSLDVPLMHIDLSEREALAASGSVDVSRDVVIIQDNEVQRSGGSSELLDRIPVSADVRLGLGKDITFQGYGLNLNMTGDLRVEQSVDRPLLAHGELFIPTGSYEIYGQRLDINDGRLLFLGNPLNPALDIRAVRNTRVAEVGLLMNGTARNIQGQLFSTPALPESEILSLLVTGNSFSNGDNVGGQDGENMLGAIALLGLEKGQGLTSSVTSKLGIDTVAIRNDSSDYRDSALGLGKYLSPNLFMRYDIGLFDRENVLTLDYILTERLRLEVETGVSQSVDLTYTVEK